MRITYRFIVKTVRLYMKLFFRYEIINSSRLQEIENCIIAANHISANDPPFLGGIIPREIYYLAKRELFKPAFFGKILEYCNAIPIRRGVVDRKALIRVKEVLAAGNSIVIFPEGTRKSNKPKPGIGKIAIETGTNVLPVFIENSNNFKACFWGKKRLRFYVGKMIDIKPFVQKGETKENYREFSAYVLDVINGLKNAG